MKIFKVLVICFFFFSCYHQPSSEQKEFYRQASKGKLTTFSCRGSDYNRYIAYLPPNYSLEHSFPVLFCFDPHADARLVAGLFRNYAEKKGMIIIASATLQNGLTQEEIALYLNQLYSDVREKLWIDTTRIFAAGFSGGARVAGIFSQLAPVTGIISCSAGYYPVTKCVSTVLIAGKYDMNYLETKSADLRLNATSCKHTFLTFEGPHQWPTVQLLSQALDILQVWRMGSAEFVRSEEGKKLFLQERQAILARLNHVSPDSLWDAVEALRIFLSTYGDLPETAALRQQYDSLVRQDKFVHLLDNNITAEKYEEEQQRIVQQAMGNQPLEWWSTTLSRWQKEENSKDEAMQAVYKRLLAYVSLLSYSYTTAAIRQRNWEAAQYVLAIYRMADPQNVDYHYFMACWYAHENKIQLALNELTLAFRGGVPVAKAMNDPLLSSLKSYLTSQ